MLNTLFGIFFLTFSCSVYPIIAMSVSPENIPIAYGTALAIKNVGIYIYI